MISGAESSTQTFISSSDSIELGRAQCQEIDTQKNEFFAIEVTH